MNITSYLVVGIAIIVILLLIKFLGEKNGLNKTGNILRWGFFIVLCALGLLSMSTVRKYMYPKDTSIFVNADYHLLEHRGFAIAQDTFNLVNDDYPQRSLLDDKSGRIRINREQDNKGRIVLTDYHEPLYVSGRVGKKNYFKLSNRLIEADASKGFEIKMADEVIYRMDIRSFGDDSCHYETVIVKDDTVKRYVSNFNKVIRKGYPLCDIIADTPDYIFTEELYQILRGTMLVRERIEIDNMRYGGEKNLPDLDGIDLVVMPGQSWYDQYPDVTVGADSIYYGVQTVEIEKDALLYSGIGHSKSDIYSLSFPEIEDVSRQGRISLRYTLPKMTHVRVDSAASVSRVFLTSSVEAVVDDPKDGGYYYNIFDSDYDHEYNIHAELKYCVGSSREAMALELMDMYSPNPAEKKSLEVDSEFHLHTLSEDVKWVFAVKDLREANNLDWAGILRILALFILFVFIRLAVDHFLQTRSLSYLELSIYVVILCMATIRLIISWRVATFVPIEDITGPVYQKMCDGKAGCTWMIWLYPIALTIWSVIRGISWSSSKIDAIGLSISEHVERLDQKCQDDKWLRWLFGPSIRIFWFFLAGLLICFIGSKVPQFNRLLNIPGPMMLYILFELWIAYNEVKYEKNMPGVRLFIGLALMGYLFKADAGFIVIFFVYQILLHCIIGPLTDGIPSLRGKTALKFLVSAIFVGVVFAILKFEGDIMISLFEYIDVISKISWLLFSLVVLPFFVYWLVRNVEWLSAVKKRKMTVYASGLVLVIACTISTGWVSGGIAEFVQGKAHMRWRAEVQRLGANETIDDLMQDCDFNSSDVTFIMRSAHNQWFINQYYKEGDSKNHNRYFQLQPHSDQGSTYTTQTTDLAITRYVTAEHGQTAVWWMLGMFLLLIAIYCLEICFGDEDGKQDRVMLGALVLLFTLALMVYLSATNRIVFIGQDFPFMSIQSKVAVLFPILLLLMATFPVMIDRMSGEKRVDRFVLINQKRAIPFYLLGLYILSVAAIDPLGEDQNDTQFDVSAIIQDISTKAEIIDRDFVRYQMNVKELPTQKDSLWASFCTAKEDWSGNLHAMEDPQNSSEFFASLLKYFESSKEKDNPDELLHMRRRNGIWHLCVNKRHFFIPSKKEEAKMWAGDVLAAKVKNNFVFSDIRNVLKDVKVTDKPYNPNILDGTSLDKITMKIVKFDTTWTKEHEPLMLIYSQRGHGQQPYYHIETSKGAIKGTSGSDLVSTRVMPEDVLVLMLQEDGQDKEMVSLRYDQGGDRYFAKNIWLNGKNKLFYPIGKDFIWSYQFANMVSSVYSKDDALRNKDIRVSLDYDLHESFTELLTKYNGTEIESLSQKSIDALIQFAQRPMERNRRSKFYFDQASSKVKPDGINAPGVSEALGLINRYIERAKRESSDRIVTKEMISEAVYETVERLYQCTVVAIDGDGKIRLMFDHGKTRSLDPNDITHFNKFLSELYKAGDNRSERDVFGNKALQIIPSGPGSSFKPIVYTSVTAGAKLDWKSLSLTYVGQGAASHKPTAAEIRDDVDNTGCYDYYGGVDILSANGNKPLKIISYEGLTADNYLIKSDNLYHSVVVLLGMQRSNEQLAIMKAPGAGKSAFPVFKYKGVEKSFNPDVWFRGGKLNVTDGVLNNTLQQNFHLRKTLAGSNERYTNYFKRNNHDEFAYLYENAVNYRGWVFAETGSQNQADRALPDYLTQGFNQLLLGAYPLEVSPLQMGTMAMRLATLNKAENITTLSDEQFTPKYEFFNTYGWNDDNDAYLSFYKTTVLPQLKEVGRKNYTGKYTGKYYIYAKTGTLNYEPGDKNDRVKHLLVIISNTDLEKMTLSEDGVVTENSQKPKYYAMYISFIGISKSRYSDLSNNTQIYSKMIDEVIESELFQEYMSK